MKDKTIDHQALHRNEQTFEIEGYREQEEKTPDVDGSFKFGV